MVLQMNVLIHGKIMAKQRKYIDDLLQNHWTNFTKLCTTHPWVKGIQVCSSFEIAKTHFLKSMILRSHNHDNVDLEKKNHYLSLLRLYIFKYLSPIHTRMLCLVGISTVVLDERRRFLKFCQCVFTNSKDEQT